MLSVYTTTDFNIVYVLKTNNNFKYLFCYQSFTSFCRNVGSLSFIQRVIACMTQIWVMKISDISRVSWFEQKVQNKPKSPPLHHHARQMTWGVWAEMRVCFFAKVSSLGSFVQRGIFLEILLWNCANWRCDANLFYR